MENKETGLQQFSNFVIFQTTDGKVNIDVFYKDNTVWLTQKALSALFEKDRSVITKADVPVELLKNHSSENG